MTKAQRQKVAREALRANAVKAAKASWRGLSKRDRARRTLNARRARHNKKK